MKDSDDLSRHVLVWLDPRRWRVGLRSGINPETLPLIEEWIGQDLPAVVRMRREDSPSLLHLGIPLSPDKGRMRVSLEVCRDTVVKASPPLSLSQVMPSAPPRWQEPLHRIIMSSSAVGLMPGVYGSLAWQHLTGKTYLSAQSDVDLLFHVRNARQLDHVLRTLQEVESRYGLKADGEFIFADGGAVAWREMLQSGGKVLVKSDRSVSLRPVADLLGTLPEKGEACWCQLTME